MPTITGTSGADTLTGSSGADTIVGGGGTDAINGGDGDDHIVYGAGAYDGGAGRDTLDLSAYNASAFFYARPLTIHSGATPGSLLIDAYIFERGGGGYTVTELQAQNFERIILGQGTSLRLQDVTTSLTIESRVSAGEYITTGSGNDVIAITTSTNAPIAFGHVIDAGAGTDTLILSGAATDYLIQQTSTGWSIYNGRAGVTTVANVEQVQFAGGSVMSWQQATAADFDSTAYMARYADVKAYAGNDAIKAYQHWQAYGMAEGRIGAFDALSYIASYRDLINVLGPNAAAGAKHYADFGMTEGRVVSFNAADYAASSLDLARIIGTDTAFAATHYILYGMNEGRATAGFDSVAYLLSNPDLAGMTPSQARTHWLTAGADEGRVGDALFGREQTSFGFSGSTAAGQFEAATDRDWFSITLPVYQFITLNGSAGVTGLSVYSATGRLIASDSDGRDFRFMITNQDGATGPAPYYVVATGASVGAYTISMTILPPGASSPSDGDLIAASVGLEADGSGTSYADQASFETTAVPSWPQSDGPDLY